MFPPPVSEFPQQQSVVPGALDRSSALKIENILNQSQPKSPASSSMVQRAIASEYTTIRGSPAPITTPPMPTTVLLKILNGPRCVSPPPELSKPVSTARKMSIPSATNQTKPANASRIGGQFMCKCCPKKPKKFENEGEVRAHEMEKKYTCQFCHNRFKNKNEAERHQNSLHLRRHFWSCAAISGFQAAFHHSAVPAAHTTTGYAYDVCGYCGEGFTNHPQPDWDCRIEHLTKVHKFGECNRAKKFYRADHFRQHLKHSHAGSSGKWTNTVEKAALVYVVDMEKVPRPDDTDIDLNTGP